jgi:hypothetical protein
MGQKKHAAAKVDAMVGIGPWLRIRCCADGQFDLPDRILKSDLDIVGSGSSVYSAQN